MMDSDGKSGKLVKNIYGDDTMIHDFLSDDSYVRLTCFFSHGWVLLGHGG